MIDNTPNPPTKFRSKNRIETNNDKLECITILVKLNLKLQYKSSFCDFSDTYILVSRTVATLAARAELAQFKHCAPFTNFISKINNA